MAGFLHHKTLFLCANFHNISLTGQQKIAAVTFDEACQAANSRIFILSNDRNVRSCCVIKRRRSVVIRYPGDATFLNILRFIPFTIYITARLQPNLIHSFGLGSSILSALLAFLFSPRLVVTIYNLESPFFWLSKLCLKRADCIITTSEFLSKKISHWLKDSSAVITHYHGVIPSQNADRNLKKFNERILYFGDSNFNRGFERIQGELGEILKSGFSLTLAVRFDDASKLDDLLKLESRHRNLQLMGKIEGNVKSFISGFDVILLPYQRTTIQPPLTLIEALMSGAIVITTAVDANHEFFFENSDLLLSHDEKITDKLLQIRNDYPKFANQAKKTAFHINQIFETRPLRISLNSNVEKSRR